MPFILRSAWVALLTALVTSASPQPPAAPRWAEVRVTHLQCIRLAPYVIAHNHPIIRFRDLPLAKDLEWRGHIKAGETVRPNCRVIFQDQMTLRLDESEILGPDQHIGEVAVKATAQSYSRTVDLKELGYFRLTYQVTPVKGPFFHVMLVNVSREPAIDQDRFEERIIVYVDGLPWHPQNKRVILPASSIVSADISLERKRRLEEPKPFPPFASVQTPVQPQTIHWGKQPPGERVVTWKQGPNRWQVKFDVQPYATE